MADVEIKPQVYKDPRPKEYFDRFHARVRDHEPEPVYEVVRVVTVMNALIAFRARGFGSEKVPNGPVILAPNHASFMDHFFTGAFIRRRIQFMGKSQLFGATPMSWIYNHGGVFPVRRGHHDEEAFISAFRILERGGAIVMYCEGGRSRNGKLAATARPGIGRLALESGVPVVPVAILGSYQVRNWKKLHFPKVTVQYGSALKFEQVRDSARDQQQQVADVIFGRMRELHDELERVGHRGAARAARGLRDASGIAPPG
jgi:1-acyl-sn-glycerol-3-phosphate acyltransferase